jgi:hypothetical protein
MPTMNDAASGRGFPLRRLSALALVVLVLARLRIDTLAEAAVLPLRLQDVAQHPWLGRLLPQRAMMLLAQQQLIDPIGLLLIVGALGCLLAYLAVDELVHSESRHYRISLFLIWAIVLLTVFAPSLKLALLRHSSGPASYSHDGGVIQTEATIDMLLHGRNPYVEDYLATPMAEWGIGEFRTALYHYPYLPWTFLFSAPFRITADLVIGWYDQRFVYLLLFAFTLLLLPGLGEWPQHKLLLMMFIGLNPIMGSDLIYGQNDSFVLAWVVLCVWLWRRGQRTRAGPRRETAHNAWVLASAAALGLACASKPTAWFFVPFYVVLAAGELEPAARRRPGAWLASVLRMVWPTLLVAALIIGPYGLWNAPAMFDDVWRWANGTSPTAYQIWGWGASNLLLAAGLVKDRFAYWPFWAPQALACLPLLAFLLWKQVLENNIARALWGYGLFLLVFLFFSRFLNENYLGYIAALLALGALTSARPATAPGTVGPADSARL